MPSAKIKSVKKLLDAFLKVSEYEIEVGRHGGGTMDVRRLVMERGDAVAILGYDPKNDVVVLVNEMRPGILVTGEDPYTDNLPAGGIGKGETAVACAVREMKEETGLALEAPEIAHPGAFVSSGGTSERIAIVAGIVDATHADGKIHGLAQESEDIKVVVLPAVEFIHRARTGALTDLKTIIAAYWLADNRDRLRGPAGKPAAKPPSGP